MITAAAALGMWFRDHDETRGGPLVLEPTVADPGTSEVAVDVSGATRLLSGKGIPGHLVERFPNAGNPNEIAAQQIRLSLPLTPKWG